MYCDHCGRVADRAVRVNSIVLCDACDEQLLLKMHRAERADAVAWWLLEMFRNNTLPVIIYDPYTLKFVAANDMALELSGYERHEIDSLTIGDVVQSPDELRSILDSRFEKSAQVGLVRSKVRHGTITVNTIGVLADYEDRPCRVVALFPVKTRVAAG